MDVPSNLLPKALEELKLSSTESNDGVQIYKLGDFKLQSGETLPDAHIAYKTFGSPNLPVIIYPTWFSGSIADNEWLISPTSTLSPQKYHIIIPALFGAGQSTSPSTTTSSPPFPTITLQDNVLAQHTLLTTHLHISHVRAILGWSMGAAQTYQWITQYPEFADIAVPFCGSARTSLHNQVFLEGVKSALLAGKGLASAGSCKGAVVAEGAAAPPVWSEEQRTAGLKAFGRVYAGWGFSQAFYRERLYETKLGYRDLEDFMVRFWEKWALSKDPENLLAMLYSWQASDVSLQPPYNGDFSAAMQAIKAKTFVMPCKTDLYFPPEDSEIEVSLMRPGVGELVPFDSIWGHWAGGPGESTEDVAWLNRKLKEFGL